MALMSNLKALIPGGAGLGGMLEFDGSCSSGSLNLLCSNSPPQRRRQSEAGGCATSVLPASYLIPRKGDARSEYSIQIYSGVGLSLSTGLEAVDMLI